MQYIYSVISQIHLLVSFCVIEPYGMCVWWNNEAIHHASVSCVLSNPYKQACYHFHLQLTEHEQAADKIAYISGSYSCVVEILIDVHTDNMVPWVFDVQYL